MAVEAAAVSLKLPIFWTSQPRVWFAQAEAQFNLRHITADDTKYYHVLAALDQPTAERLLDLISAPPAKNKYPAIRKRLLDVFALSRRDRAVALLRMRDIGLGDKKPSAIMDEILALVDDGKLCLLSEQIFLDLMPVDIRVLLAEDEFQDPRALARRADILWMARPQSTLNAVHKLQAVHKPPSSKQEEYKDFPMPKYRSQTHNAEGICFYHQKFGKEARQCMPPCTFSGNFKAGRQ